MSEKQVEPKGGRKQQKTCGFCYRSLVEVKTCSQCKKRTYCSRECQLADWKPGAGGQGHKIWCKSCGEEGVDWEVRYISEEKGYGLFALRDFKQNERILVERIILLEDLDTLPEPTRAAIDSLMPAGGSLLDKFEFNAFENVAPPEFEAELKSFDALSVRLSRVNHACSPNAYQICDYKLKVHLLLSRVLIKAGEEICITYVPALTSPRYEDSMADAARFLKERWNITCPADCACKDVALRAKAQRARELYKRMEAAQESGQLADALRAAEDLLKAQMELQQPASFLLDTMYCLIEFYLEARNLSQAMKVTKMAHDLTLKVTGEHSSDAAECRKYLKEVEERAALLGLKP